MLKNVPTHIGIITKPNEPRADAVAQLICEWAAIHGISLLVDEQIEGTVFAAPRSSKEEIADCCDLLIVLGGDGTMIATARLVSGRGTPVLGINLGLLGYLPEFSVEYSLSALEDVISGNYMIDRRTMLEWSINRDGNMIEAGRVLNDVVVNKSALARIIEIDCFIGLKHVTTYRGDGMIIATPTGSTAYNLSAGGPIVYPNAEVISIAPICPHTLTNRPLVLPDTLAISLRLVTKDQEVMLTADGQTGFHLLADDRVEIWKSEKTFNMVRPSERDYFQVLRDKLKWSGR